MAAPKEGALKKVNPDRTNFSKVAHLANGITINCLMTNKYSLPSKKKKKSRTRRSLNKTRKEN